MSSAPPKIEIVGMTKRFGRLTALDTVSLRFEPGCFHALLGENGAGKSTLVKCLIGTYRADQGSVLIDDKEQEIASPRDAKKFGLGMVYQHFTLVPSMSVAENLILADQPVPAIVPWRETLDRLDAFMADMPFRLELDKPISSLAAGEKQKLEILKQLYIGSRFLILDEPTSVLTPDEADQILGHMRTLSDAGDISIVLITHKLREVEAYAREVSVLRGGEFAGGGTINTVTRGDMVRMMIGRESVSPPAAREKGGNHAVGLEIKDLKVLDDNGLGAVNGVDLAVRKGEILGVAGVSGNGQTELLETLAGQRDAEDGTILIEDKPYNRTRREMRDYKVHILPEAPLQNGCVRELSVAANLAIRNFDEDKNTLAGIFVNRSRLAKQAVSLIDRFRIKTQSPQSRIETLSGGNVQRTVLARELAEGVEVLIVQNPCFGLDLDAVSETRNRIMKARNEGAAVLLISEDLDEILELSDRIAVMFEGEITHNTTRDDADIHILGHFMASHE
ncbi:MAG: ABC transporter ATP-binding protein [Pseudomonadota bacterium]